VVYAFSTLQKRDVLRFSLSSLGSGYRSQLNRYTVYCKTIEGGIKSIPAANSRLVARADLSTSARNAS
jgi:hypothetical protein